MSYRKNLLAACMMFMTWSAAHGIAPYDTVKFSRDEQIAINLSADDEVQVASDVQALVQNVEVAAAMPGNRNGHRDDARWSLWGIDSDGNRCFCVTVSWGNEGFDESFSRRYLAVAVDSIGAGGNVEVLRTNIFDDVDLYRGVNVLSLEILGGVASLRIGNDYQRVVGNFTCSRRVAGFVLSADSQLRVDYVVSEWQPDPAVALRAPMAVEKLNTLLQQASGIEGIWEFLDRDTNAEWAEPGGYYRLGVVKHCGDGEEGVYNGRKPLFDIIYLDGAAVNAAGWHPGMIKGRMYATPFENHYDVVWYDAMMEWMGREVSADFTSPAILSFHFPLHHAQLRFSRVQ